MRVWVGQWVGTASVRTNASPKPCWLHVRVCSFKVAGVSPLLIAHARRPGEVQLSKHPRFCSLLQREVLH